MFVVYLLKFALESVIKNKKIIFIIICIIITICTIPSFIYQNGILYMYYGTQSVLNNLKTNYGSLPCIYIYTDATEMFNNFVYNYSFLLQSDKVYITSLLSPESVKEILKDVDVSNGILLYDVDYNVSNTLRILELEEFNTHKLIANTYTGCVFYFYYDPNLVN